MARLLLLLSLFPLPARAAELLLAGRIDRVVAAGALIGVVREGEVRVLSAQGRALARLPLEDAPELAARRADSDDDVLEENGIAFEDRDSEYAEALVDDEASLRDRRSRRASRLEAEDRRPPLLAGSAGGLWLAAGRTLWRADESGRLRRVSLLEQRLDHLAVGPDGRLLAASGARLWLSRDGGLTFDRLTDADGPVYAVAAGEGVLGWSTAGQLTRVELGRVVTHPVAAPRALAACGPTLLALDAHGLLALGPDGPRALPAGRDAHGVACAGATWVLVGRRLLVSRDEGRTFLAPTDLPLALPLDAAAGAEGLWVATDAGLYRLGGAPAPRPLPGPLLLIPPVPRWAPYLPRFTVVASAVRAGGREDLRTVAYADFPLAPPRPAPPALRLAQLVFEPAPTSAPLPADREASCLTVARNEAVARALVEPERARSYVSRAGYAAWLPELRVLMNRRLGRSESLDVPSGGSVASGPLGLDTANDVRYEARATWDLSKLVFSTEEIAAVTAALRMADLRREVESLANRLYFERRRLKMEPALSPTSDARPRRDLRVEELEAELDAMSGGAFTRCLPAPP